MPVCSHCGELFPDGRLNCPHCGMDVDQDWSADPEYGELGYDNEDEEYAAFLKREGLGEPEKSFGKRGCAPGVLLGVLICTAVWVLI